MNHLDEGTIHAWLDGALDAERARSADAHVASCAQCSAAVAEARGLIAGASRILTALDDVPAGVMPKGVPAAPAWGPRATRQWRAAPWVLGIAATLMLAVGVTQWRKGQAQGARAAFERAAATESPAVAARADEANRARESAATVAKAAAPQRRSEQPPRVAQRPASAAGAGTSGGVAELSGRAVAAAPAPAPAATSALDRTKDAAAPEVAGGELKKEPLAAPNAALVPPRSSAPPRILMRGATVDPAIEHARDVAAAGCYRIDFDAVRRTATTEAKAAGAGERAAPTAARAPQTRPAAADQVVVSPPDRVQLDTTPEQRGLVVRSVLEGARLGFWYRVRDSIRVELLAAGGYTLPSTARVACP